MLKVVLTAAIVLSVGVLSFLKPSTPQKPETASVAKVMMDTRTVLATAD